MNNPSYPVIPIIYEDNHLLVVEKPVNVPTQQDKSGDPDMLSLLKEDLRVRHNKPGNVYLGLVHRLDRPVGGVMVFAKTSKAASRLSEQVRTRQIEKVYFAVAHGRVSSPQERWTDYLVKDRSTNQVFTVSSGSPGAQKAVLHYSVIGMNADYTLTAVQLHTGRPHQIRVQFASRKLPLYGDQKYGSASSKPGEQIALWSGRLSFLHPTRQESLTFTSMPPRTMPWKLWLENSYEFDTFPSK